jgi:hypothetical protein
MKNESKESGTPITVLQRMVLATVLGGTNLGMPNPTQQQVDYIAKNNGDSLESMIYSMWSRYMDSEETEQGFLDECNWWYSARDNLNNKKVTVEYVHRVWPDVAKLVFGDWASQPGTAPAVLTNSTVRAIRGNK